MRSISVRLERLLLLSSIKRFPLCLSGIHLAPSCWLWDLCCVVRGGRTKEGSCGSLAQTVSAGRVQTAHLTFTSSHKTILCSDELNGMFFFSTLRLQLFVYGSYPGLFLNVRANHPNRSHANPNVSQAPVYRKRPL
jgi:hypothetical protein